MRMTFGAALTAGLGVLGATVQADQMQFTANHDVALYQDATGSLANGAGASMLVGLNAQSLIRRSLVSFDISAIPAGASVSSATLSFGIAETIGGTRPLAFYRTLASWNEGASNPGTPGDAGAPAATGDATWLHRNFNSSLWANPGGDFAPAASAVTTITEPAGLTLQVTLNDPQLGSDVQAWINNPAGNFGWMVRGDESTPGSAMRLFTHEATSPPFGASQGMRLNVTYTVPGTGAGGALAMGLGLAARRRRLR